MTSIKYFITFMLFCTASVLFAQNNCSEYYPMKAGTTLQYTHYNKKEKVEGTTDYVVSQVTDQSTTMHLTFTDRKGKNIIESDYTITCTANGIKIDYQTLIPSQLIKQYKDMGVEMDITGTDLELPNKLSVGQKLSDAYVNMAIKMVGINMKTEVKTINRTVEKQETISTPAGNFDCYVIYADIESKTMGSTQTFPSRLWLAKGVGMIKQETYNKNGDLMNKMELTKFSN